MLSKAKIKYIKSLQVKKYRKEEQCFIVEGAKSVLELLASDFEVVQVLGTPAFLSGLQSPYPEAIEVLTVSEKELVELGNFQTNNAALGVAKIRPNASISILPEEFALVLDDIRDPGNLGTIVRTADWFGIDKIIASTESADFYNPKVINATMGSFTRVRIFYTDLAEYLRDINQKVYGAYLDGTDIHKMTFEKGGLVIIGNEARGIRAGLEEFVTDKITIPRYGKAESLNAAIATAIICDNIVRSKRQVF